MWCKVGLDFSVTFHWDQKKKSHQSEIISLGFPEGYERKSELPVALKWQQVTIQQMNQTDGMKCQCEIDKHPDDGKEETA